MMLPIIRRSPNWWPSLFNEIFENEGYRRVAGSTTPAINVIENQDNYTVEVAAPGMTKKIFAFAWIRKVA